MNWRNIIKYTLCIYAFMIPTVVFCATGLINSEELRSWFSEFIIPSPDLFVLFLVFAPAMGVGYEFLFSQFDKKKKSLKNRALQIASACNDFLKSSDSPHNRYQFLMLKENSFANRNELVVLMRDQILPELNDIVVSNKKNSTLTCLTSTLNLCKSDSAIALDLQQLNELLQSPLSK